MSTTLFERPHFAVTSYLGGLQRRIQISIDDAFIQLGPNDIVTLVAALQDWIADGGIFLIPNSNYIVNLHTGVQVPIHFNERFHGLVFKADSVGAILEGTLKSVKPELSSVQLVSYLKIDKGVKVQITRNQLMQIVAVADEKGRPYTMLKKDINIDTRIVRYEKNNVYTPDFYINLEELSPFICINNIRVFGNLEGKTTGDIVEVTGILKSMLNTDLPGCIVAANGCLAIQGVEGAVCIYAARNAIHGNAVYLPRTDGGPFYQIAQAVSTFALEPSDENFGKILDIIDRYDDMNLLNFMLSVVRGGNKKYMDMLLERKVKYAVKNT